MVTKMEKIEVGKKYRNLHTGRICEVVNKIFFNVVYSNDDEPPGMRPHYCHYRTFQKNWARVEEKE